MTNPITKIKTKKVHTAPILFVQVKDKYGKKLCNSKYHRLKALVDTDASKSIMAQACANWLKISLEESNHKFLRAGGQAKTLRQTPKISIKLLELNPTGERTTVFQILDMTSNRYDVIIGRDLMVDIGLNVNISTEQIVWNDAAIPWRDIDNNITVSFFYEPQEKDMQRINNILDAKYQKANLDTSVKEIDHLSFKEKKQLLKLLRKYEHLFDGTLGK